MSRQENGLQQNQRLCHMVKRADFDGYGFNLHSEKGKVGQYIGKVDKSSPAEESGLRQGDRIIEVNGVNIGNESHKEVVKRIKAITNEVRLLVIDPEIEKNQKPEKSTDDTKSALSVTETETDKITTENPTVSSSENEYDDKSSNINNNNNDINANHHSQSKPTTPINDKKDSNSHVSVSLNNNNHHHDDTSDLVKPMSTEVDSHHVKPSSSPTPVVKSVDIPLPLPPNDPPPTTQGAGQTSEENGPSLNLKMTAAEMRAKLLSRKKYDPKSESVDLRKKFEIIQKL